MTIEDGETVGRAEAEVPAESRRRVVLWSAVILGAAGVVRFSASLGDFWFDEIWSWSITLNLSSPWSILTRIRHENNHYFNTWLIWLIGSDAPWVLYRLPAVLAGMGSVALAGKLAACRRGVDGLTAMILVGASYLCIHYSSEARGYAYVVFFALLAVVLQERALVRRRPVTDLLLAATIVLGMLSHLAFLYCWAALLGWAALRALRNRSGLASLVISHGPPALFSAWLYFVNVRFMTTGGGQTLSPFEIVLSALSQSLGGPAVGPASWLFALAAAAMVLLALAYSKRSGSDWWIFYAGVICIAPALLLVVAGRDLYVRYFLVAVVFALILISRLLGELWVRGRVWRIAYFAVLGSFLLANGVHTARLIQIGRGQYERALHRILEESRSSPGSIGSDHDFRNALIFMYYRRGLSVPESLYFHMRENWPSGGPEWFIRHSLDLDYRPERDYVDPWGNRYSLAQTYPYAGLSGWNWAVYRNERQLGP